MNSRSEICTSLWVVACPWWQAEWPSLTPRFLRQVVKADLRDLAVLECPDGGSGPRGSNGALLVL